MNTRLTKNRGGGGIEKTNFTNIYRIFPFYILQPTAACVASLMSCGLPTTHGDAC